MDPFVYQKCHMPVGAREKDEQGMSRYCRGVIVAWERGRIRLPRFLFSIPTIFRRQFFFLLFTPLLARSFTFTDPFHHNTNNVFRVVERKDTRLGMGECGTLSRFQYTL